MSPALFLDLVILVDTSASMAPCLPILRQQLPAFLRQLREGNEQWNIPPCIWRASLGTFCREPGEAGKRVTLHLHPFTEQPEEMDRQLSTLSASAHSPEGPRPLLEALHAVIHRGTSERHAVPEASHWRHRFNALRGIAVFTDADFAPAPEPQPGAELEEIQDALMKQHMRLHLTAPETENFFFLAEADGCCYKNINSQENTAAAIGETLQQSDFFHYLQCHFTHRRHWADFWNADEL